MKYRIRHYTEYTYDDLVSLCYNRLCLTPLNTERHTCLSSEINITPQPEEISYRKDFFGNDLTFFSNYKEHTRLRISATSIVSILEKNSHAESSSLPWKDVQQLILNTSEGPHDIIQYILPSQYVPYSDHIREFAAVSFEQEPSLWGACNHLMRRIFKEIKFTPGFTTVNTPVESVLKLKKGVCQDLAHLMIACLRNYGLPARYVSGYLETVPPPGKEKLVGADASHAWVSVYFPDAGWLDFDPTNNLLPSSKHITIAYGRDYFDIAPIKGIVFSSGNQKLTVKVDVERMEG
jgi:transglutaminase-like putative cysteine protease